MSNYSEYFLKSASNIVQLETLQIYHPNFSKTYWIVRNALDGITATLENGASQFFEQYPVQIKNNGNQADLDSSYSIVLGDLGDILPKELDLVSQNNGFSILPKITYRVYRSDSLTQILYGPIALEVDSFAFNNNGATFKAKAPSLNVLKTGELYTPERFPMLRGFL